VGPPQDHDQIGRPSAVRSPRQQDTRIGEIEATVSDRSDPTYVADGNTEGPPTGHRFRGP
jgi:hypothetical protein